jgi:hypothetical protein
MVPTPPRETVRISENQQQKERQPGIKKGVARSFTKRLWRFKDFCSDVGVGCGWPSDLLTAGDQSGALSSLQA